MSTLTYPSILDDLGRAGNTGLPLAANDRCLEELELCRRWGFNIAVSEGRARLIFDHEQIVRPWLEDETPAMAWDSLNVIGFLRLGSTNSEAHAIAERGAPEGTLVISEEQTGGRGRKDRAWHSPPSAGLYCTLILRPKQPQHSWPLLTHVASIAMVEAILELSDRNIVPLPLDVDIKWPNDVLLSGKKCAGILLEVLWDSSKNPVTLLGFGVNVHAGSVPENLAGEATCLDAMAHTRIPRRLFLVLYLKHFQIWYLMFEKGMHERVLARWKQRSSMWNGVPVYIGRGEMRREAVTCGVNDLGALMVRDADGRMETIFAEDISISRKRL